jgi:lipoprotein-releasing system ATP-binding protein
MRVTSALATQRGQPDTQPVVEAYQIVKEYVLPSGTIRVLRGVDLSVRRGESVAIMGPSGSGKSTLLHVLGTLERPTEGTLLLLGLDPCQASDQELARFRNENIGFVFQDHYLLPYCTALENVLLPALPWKRRPEAPKRALELLAAVGLAERLHHYPSQLSGGEQQRVALVRALMNMPALLLADEPTGNLDPRTAREVGDLLVDVCRHRGVALVLATHSEELARRCSRRLALTDGRLEPL